jgi:hypothetical protein
MMALVPLNWVNLPLPTSPMVIMPTVRLPVAAWSSCRRRRRLGSRGAAPGRSAVAASG